MAGTPWGTALQAARVAPQQAGAPMLSNTLAMMLSTSSSSSKPSLVIFKAPPM